LGQHATTVYPGKLIYTSLSPWPRCPNPLKVSSRPYGSDRSSRAARGKTADTGWRRLTAERARRPTFGHCGLRCFRPHLLTRKAGCCYRSRHSGFGPDRPSRVDFCRPLVKRSPSSPQIRKTCGSLSTRRQRRAKLIFFIDVPIVPCATDHGSSRQ